MNIQPAKTNVMPVQQPVRSGAEKDEAILTVFGTGVGAMVGYLVTNAPPSRTGKNVLENDVFKTFMIKPDVAPLLGGIAGFFVGKGVYRGLCALEDGARVVSNVKDRLSNFLVEVTGCASIAQESNAVKACACLGAVWSMLAGREMMYSLIDIDNPFPNSFPCRVITGVGNEVINDSPLLLVGASAGYLAGKGIECVARTVYSGIDMAGRGVASLVIPVRPDVMVEPEGDKKAA